MNALTFWDVLKGAFAFGFVAGWVSGLFVGLWTMMTLGMM